MKNLKKFGTLGRFTGLLVVLAAFALLASACGDDGNKGGTSCDEGETYVNTINGEVINDCVVACNDGACPAGLVCLGNQVCLEDESGGNTGTNSNTGNSNTGTNSNTGNSNTGTAPTPEQEQLCEDVCNLLIGDCLRDTCTVTGQLDTNAAAAFDECVNGAQGSPSCAQELASDAELETAYQDFIGTTTCEDRKLAFCGQIGLTDACNCATPTNVGGTCTMDEDCDSGDLNGGCITDGDGLPGGYCVAAPCPTEGAQAGDNYLFEGCGAGNVCAVSADQQSGQLFGTCLDGCSSGADCREGYVCSLEGVGQDPDTSELVAVRTCLPPVCEMAEDCGGGQRCNMGKCEFVCSEEDAGGGQTVAQVCAGIGGTCTDDGSGTEYCILP